MAQTKKQIQDILQSIGGSPRHRYGQNFMIDGNIVRAVADAGEITGDDLVIEVGPGTGTLTEELLVRAGKVVAVEIDRDLAGMLRERFARDEKFVLIEGDALAGKHELNEELAQIIGNCAKLQAGNGGVKLIANLPYNIASPLIIELLLTGVELLAFTVQKEVADRLRGGAGSDDYGPLTVMVQMLGEVEVLRTLPPQVFWPQPKIDSALVRVRLKNRLGERARDFGEFVQKLFQARRKTLRKAMDQAGFDAEKALGAANIDGQLRVENLPPERLLELFERAREG
jgi:16S rRNA (adenine1518-N6/adenine1519-N6)-dimethyltransferase